MALFCQVAAQVGADAGAPGLAPPVGVGPRTATASNEQGAPRP